MKRNERRRNLMIIKLGIFIANISSYLIFDDKILNFFPCFFYIYKKFNFHSWFRVLYKDTIYFIFIFLIDRIGIAIVKNPSFITVLKIRKRIFDSLTEGIIEMATIHDSLCRCCIHTNFSWSMLVHLVKQKLSIPSGNGHGLELSCIGFQPDDAKSYEGGEGCLEQNRHRELKLDSWWPSAR